MTIEQIKELIKTVYTGYDFGKRLDKMSEKQIMAIYYRLKKAGRLP